MKINQVINVEKALAEKKEMQAEYLREHGYPSPVLALLIAYFEQRKEK